MIMHLGVEDLPYSEPEHQGDTTAEVAQKLEDEYQVMQHFADHHADFISIAIENDISKGIDALMRGLPLNMQLNGACDKIKVMFNYFLDNKEMDYQVPGVPTKASLQGKSSRLKKGLLPGTRPSFIDTGLYEQSFRAWVDDKHN